MKIEFVMRFPEGMPKSTSQEKGERIRYMIRGGKNKKFWGQYKDTRPDLDNSVKLLNDMMTRCRYWKDDSQVVDLHVIKRYAEEASIYVRLSEAKEEET